MTDATSQALDYNAIKQAQSTPSRWMHALVLALVAVLTCHAGGARAQVSQPGPGQQAPPDQQVLEPPTAHFSWSVPERYSLGWRAWSERRARYSRAYIRPRWQVSIDACGSSGGGEPIIGYDIAISGAGFDFRTRSRGTRCRRRFGNLPRLGGYDVTLVVRTRRGPSQPLTQRIVLRDHLIVSLGDSMASGEGVPDRRGLYGYPLTQTLSTLEHIFSGDFRPREVRRVHWSDRRCHRSARAGHALAAWALERRDPQSSVTYVSLACSGATIANLIDEDYAGIQRPRTGGKLDPQLDALRALVGDRRIDALLLSIGVNDLGFSGIVKGCAMNWNGALGHGNSRCVYDKVDGKYGPLDRSYARLGAALRDGLDVAEVYVTDYPAAPFGETRGGCGLLGLPRVGIAEHEARAMYRVGLRLNWALGSAAAEQGWNWVPGMAEAFDGRDYCARDSLLVRLESSLLRQGNKSGAVHPTRAGHGALANLLLRSIVFRPEFPHWRAKLIVEQVLVESAYEDVATPAPPPDRGDPPKPLPPGSDPGPDYYGFIFSLREIPNWLPRLRRFSFPKTSKGRWISVPAEQGTFELDVYDPPRPPRHPTSVDFLTYGPASGTVGEQHPFAQGFGVGCHERRHPAGWAVRYRIEITRVDDPVRPPIKPPGQQIPPCSEVRS